MGNSFTFYSFLALMGCLVTGVCMAWLLYRRPDGLPQPLKISLAAARAVTISVILWLLFSPLIRQVSYTLEKPIIIIAQDNSESIAAVTPAGFDSIKYRNGIQQLGKELSEKYDVRLYHFGDRVGRGLDFSYKGKLTDASALVNQLTDELLNRNVGAIILASDGIFNKGGNPAGDMATLKAPVYTIALGDTIPKKDLLIADVNSNDLVYLDNEFKLDIQLQAYQCNREGSKLIVSENGKTIHEQMLQINSDQFSKNIKVSLKASKLGAHQYVVSVVPLKDEVFLKNNSRKVIVEVIDDRQKILIASAGPHPDLAAIKGALSLNKHYDVSLQMQEQLSAVELKGYGLVILYQLPGLQYDSRAFLEKVRLSEVPVWYILGAQSNISQFNLVQSNVGLTGNNGTLVYNYSDVNTSFSSFDLDPASRTVIQDFDPLQAPSGQVKISGDVQVVLNQRKDKSKAVVPQLFFMNVNGRKAGYLIGEGLWKWKFSEARTNEHVPVFNSVVGKIIQYLSVKDDQRKFVVRPAKQIFDENEHVLINATLYNDSYVPVNSADVTIQLRDEKGKAYNFSFSKFESAYQLDAGILPAGNYRYSANADFSGKKYGAKGAFFINALTAEFQQTIANHQLLYQLSAQTNGKMYYPNQLQQLKKQLASSKQMKTLSYEDRKYEELVNFKWLFGFILVLLSVEWLMRKRNGAL